VNVPPAAPVVTLTSDVASVASGGTANLTWTSQNATTCSASGGWTGSQQISGTVKTAAITTATTYTLSCNGVGGTTSKSVTVNVDAPSQTGGGGGGGAMNPATLYALALLVLFRLGNVARNRNPLRAFPARRTRIRHLRAVTMARAATAVLANPGGVQ
jgi:hypothetical protein